MRCLTGFISPENAIWCLKALISEYGEMMITERKPYHWQNQYTEAVNHILDRLQSFIHGSGFFEIRIVGRRGHSGRQEIEVTGSETPKFTLLPEDIDDLEKNCGSWSGSAHENTKH